VQARVSTPTVPAGNVPIALLPASNGVVLSGPPAASGSLAGVPPGRRDCANGASTEPAPSGKAVSGYQEAVVNDKLPAVVKLLRQGVNVFADTVLGSPGRRPSAPTSAVGAEPPCAPALGGGGSNAATTPTTQPTSNPTRAPDRPASRAVD
jgi:hypothetical protein